MSGELVVYGIRECDSCRKAQRWLHEQGIEFRFHDLRKDGFDAQTARRWAAAVGAEKLVNRRGRTWKELDDVDRQRAMDYPGHFLSVQPLLIKRPVFEKDGEVRVGFQPDELKRWLNP